MNTLASGPLCAMRGRATDIPAHAIVGDYTPTVNDLADLACLANTAIREPALSGVCKVWGLVKLAGFDTRVSTNFPLGGDLIVTVGSQRDGFADLAPQVSQYDHIHMAFADRPAALETDTVADRAVELLNAAPGDAALFGEGFPTSACTAAPQRLAVSSASLATVAGGIQITSPGAGSTVQPGQTLTVTVAPDAGVSLSTLMLTSPGDVQQDVALPWEFALTIPDLAVGPFNLAAVGKDAAGTFYSAETWLNVVPASALSTLSVSPANVVLTDAGLPQSLVVLGNYADASQRDLSGARTGTVFVSQDPAVASVDVDGRVTAAGNGSTTIAVTNGTATGTVVVVVQMETDLGVTQTPVPSPVVPGAELAYGIAVTNIGPAAREVQVEDRLPTGSLFISASGEGWGCIEAGGVVHCYRESLDAGATATINLVVNTPPSCSLITNQVAVNASTPDGNADNNVSIVATPCRVPTYALTVAKDGTGSGTTNGGGSYPAGAPVALAADAATGSTFTGWSPSPCAASFAMPTANLTCTATFTLNTYALAVSKAGTGSGTVGGDGTYATGAPVTLTATADTGSIFAGWGPSPCAAGFVMPPADLTCIATFTANRYAVTALAGTNGHISPATQMVNHGATAAFTVTPNTGYLATATGCGGTLTGTTYATGSITGACTVSAGFARAYPLTLTKAGTGSGRVTGTGIDCGSDCTETYAGGTSVTLTASPAGSSNFAGWRGACLGTGGCTVTIGAASSAMGVTANFSLKTYPITLTAVPAAGGTVTCTPNPVSHGASSSCSATPKAGYTLTAFSGACTGTSCALINVTEAKGLTANFGLKTYPITATANPVVGGTVTCTPNPVPHSSGSTCTAAPNVGYTLSAFTGCVRIGTTSQCALTGVTSAKTVIATFSPAKYPITATASPLAGGTVTCIPNPVTHGTNSSCTATAKTGYSLGAFSSGCTRIGTTSRCTLTGVTAPKTVTVTFVPNTYSITASANPLAGGTMTCTPNPVPHGSGTTCTAAPNVGYTLSAFTGCTRSGATSQCTLTGVTAAKTVIATFSPAKYPITATASPLAGGTVTCTPNPVSHGASSTCTARPKTGYAFAGFSGACTGASCVLNNVTAAQGVAANFTVLTLRIDDVSRVEGNLGTSAATFTVTLSAVGAGTVTVRYATANVEALAGSDYTAAGGTLAFLPGQTSKTLTVNLRGDTAVESDETFVVNLSAPAGATLLDKQGLGTIRNDD